MKALFMVVSCLFLSFNIYAATAEVNLEEAFSVTSLTVTSNGSTIIAAFSDGVIRSFKANSGKIVDEVRMPKNIASIIEVGGKVFVAADKLYLAELNSGKITEVAANNGRAVAVAADKLGEFAAAAHGMTLAYYNLISARATISMRTPSEITALAVDTLTQTVFTVSKDGFIRKYDMAGGAMLGETSPKLGTLLSVAVSESNVVVGGERGAAVLDKSFKSSEYISRHTDMVRTVATTPNGRFVITGGDDGLTVVTDMTAERIESFKESYIVNHTAIDPHMRYILSAYMKLGDMGGYLQLRYTADKNEERKIYAFRDASMTLNKAGFVDGKGPFGKYVHYDDGKSRRTFNEVANVVHRPQKLEYAMKQPKISASQMKPVAKLAIVDTEGPVIAVDERGIAPVKADEIKIISGTITDSSGIAWAKVDERPLRLANNGSFRIDITIPPEGKRVIISAADINSNISSRVLNYGTSISDLGQTVKKTALLIAINNYKYLPALRTPEYDARTFGEILKNRYGYEVKLLLDRFATREAILGEVNALSGADSVIVYFAGHGRMRPDGGDAYWQTYDSSSVNDTRSILTSELSAVISSSKIRQALIIADSCFSGAISTNNVQGGALKVIITSGGVEPISDISGSGHSLFTGALLNSLRKGNTVTSKQLFGELTDKIGNRQRPEHKALTADDFVFVAK